MASVKLDVATHARVSAAAALAGTDRSAWMFRAISDALRGVVVIDRRGREPADRAADEAEKPPETGD